MDEIIRYREHFYTSKIKELPYDDFIYLIKEPQCVIKTWKCFKKVWKEKPKNEIVEEYFIAKTKKLQEDEYYLKHKYLNYKIGDIQTDVDDKQNSSSYGKWVSIQFYEYPTFRVVSQCYTINDYVKPYFDFDEIDYENIILDQNKSDNYLEKIKQILEKEFVHIDLIWASNHRQIEKDGEKCFKYSFHVLLNGIYTKVKYLGLFVEKLNYEMGYEFFDPSVYNKTGIFRVSNQKKNEDDEPPILSHSIENYVIHNITDNDKEYTNTYKPLDKIETVEDLVNIKTPKHSNRLTVNYSNNGTPLFDDNAYTPTPQQLSNLKTLLFDLPEMYYTLYSYWRNVCFAMKHYSNSKEIYDIFDKFSQQSHNYGGTSTLWNSTKNDKGDKGEKGCNYTLGSLISIHKKMYILDLERKKEMSKLRKEMNDIFEKEDTIYDIEEKKKLALKKEYLEQELEKLNNIKSIKKINYGTLVKYENYDELLGLELLKIKTERITEETISTRDLYTPHVKIYPNTMHLIKSATGTGKTIFIQKCIIDKYKKSNIISITSRRSLALAHSVIFDLTYYEDGKKRLYYENISLQLDSLDRLGEIEGEYILVLDEVNSLMRHLLNGMSKMRENRLIFTDRLMKLIDKSYMTIAVDSDISTYVLDFIKSNINMEMRLTINDYKQTYDIPVIQYPSIHCLVDIAKNIKKCGDNFVVLSDSKTKLEEFTKVLEKEGIIKHPFEILDKDGNFKGLIENDKMHNIYIKIQEKYYKEIQDIDKDEILSEHEKITKIMEIKKRKEEELNKQPDEVKYSGILLLYTGDSGDRSDFSNVNTVWKWADIGASPTLLYGISYDLKYTHHIICLYYNNIELSADQYLQQIARIRYPISISLFIDNYYPINYFESKEELKKYYLEEDKNYPDIGKIIDPEDANLHIRIQTIFKFFYEEKYHVYKYKCLQYYIPKLLDKKGFINYKIAEEDEKQTQYIFEKIEKDIELICKQFGNKNLNGELMTKYKKRMEIYKMSIDSDIEHLRFIFDDKYYDTLYAYFEQQKGEYINKYYEKKDPIDYDSLEKKLMVMDNLHKKLGIKWWYIDFARDYKEDDSDIKISNKEISEMKKAFRISNKVKIIKTYNNLYRRLLTCYNNLFSVCFDSAKLYKNGKEIRYMKYNVEKNKTLKDIFDKCYINTMNIKLRK